jgi:hypothetical protein
MFTERYFNTNGISPNSELSRSFGHQIAIWPIRVEHPIRNAVIRGNWTGANGSNGKIGRCSDVATGPRQVNFGRAVR